MTGSWEGPGRSLTLAVGVRSLTLAVGVRSLALAVGFHSLTLMALISWL